jgi:excisionase family DNA binding protein
MDDTERAIAMTASEYVYAKLEPLLTDSEAARFLGGLHPKTVQRMARRGELPHYRIGKYYRYRVSELSAWLVLHSSGQNNPSAQDPKEIQ